MHIKEQLNFQFSSLRRKSVFFISSYEIKVFHIYGYLEQGVKAATQPSVPCELAPPYLGLRIATSSREAGELVRSDTATIRTTKDIDNHF